MPHSGAVTRSGGLGVMRQAVGRGATSVAELLLSVAPPRVRQAAAEVDRLELALMDTDDEATQMAYAHALSEFADAGGYDIEVVWDTCCTAALGVGFDQVKYRDLATLSGGEQKRLVLEYLLAGPDQVLLLDEPDNFLDVPGKIWLEQRIRESVKTIIFISHDREGCWPTPRPGWSPSSWAPRATPPGRTPAATRRTTRRAATGSPASSAGPGRWEEEHEKLRALMLMYKDKAAFRSDMASRYRASQTRLRKFEEAGPPTGQPREQQVSMRLTGGRTGKRAVVCGAVEAEGLMKPFDLEVWYGERVAVLGSNGSGKSHFLRLLAAGGSDPDVEHRPVGEVPIAPVRHTGRARLGARVRPGWFVQTHAHPDPRGAHAARRAPSR